MMVHMRFAIVIIALLAAALGCRDGQDYDTELAGIYRLTSWTHNPDGCAEEGPEVVDAQRYTHFYLRSDEFLGVPFVGMSWCRSLAECRSWSADYDTVFTPGFRFDAGGDEGGWTGHDTAMTEGGDGDGTCEGEVLRALLTGAAGAAVRIEEETMTVGDVPAGDRDVCDEELAFEKADQSACEQLTVVTGTYLEPLGTR